ncbi:MAG TPA: HD domain-containing phosphohydrolase [Baekduia sp.]|uniref:HD domain-containing phosphohydrolase n=1 Tax=Baekduia sp. TaxID=2600305 RepID=UPI002D78F376|nr:HD domain-containing phosphohydrolase [Baekduia sp.]HET6507151.1 HD domain-containing phosphohydrolase [Baekduia sp.]
MSALPRSGSHARAVLLAGLLAAACGLGLWATGVSRSLEETTVAWRFHLRPAHAPSDLVVVGVDDATLSDYAGRHGWPYPRSWHAQVLDELRRLGARRVVYDVQFTEQTTPTQDRALFDAVGRFPGTVLATTETDGHGGTNVFGGDDHVAAVGARAAMASFPILGGGEIARVEPSADGVPTIAVAAAESLGHRVDVRAFERGGAWIDYRGPPGTIPELSFSDVREGRVPASAIRGKVVVVGMVAPTGQDVHPTPTVHDELMSGPEVQANALWTVLHDLPLRSAPGWVGALTILLMALAPAAAALRLRTLSVLTAPVAALAFLGAAYLAFRAGWVVAVVPPLAALALSAVGTVTASYLTERRERRRVSRHNAVLEQAVRERTAELHETQLEVVARLARAAEWRDEDTGEHVERIGRLSERLALAAGWSATAAETLRHAAVLHDVGKIGVPDRVLLKPGKLDPEEWAIMKTHAEIGASMLSGSPSPLVRLGEEIARTHHERWDGSGYPRGLAGEEIPIAGRIVAICDVFDALRSRRPYKAAWTLEDALNEIAAQSGRHFDPELVALFVPLARELGDIATRDGDDDGQLTLAA